MTPIDTILARSGPAGVFLRFVRRHTGRDDLFTVHGRALVGSGRPARVYVAARDWLLSDDPDDARALLSTALADPLLRELYWAAPGAPGALPEGFTSGTDLLFVGDPQPFFRTHVLSDEALYAVLDRVDPELADDIPPPSIRAQLPFRLHGLMFEDRIVAVCDTTVDDGEWIAIQQVHTATRVRGRGLATALVRGVLGMAHAEGRRLCWVCDERNTASAAVATRVGLLLHSKIPLLVRS